MRSLILVAAAALSLAACDRGTDVTNDLTGNNLVVEANEVVVVDEDEGNVVVIDRNGGRQEPAPRPNNGEETIRTDIE